MSPAQALGTAGNQCVDHLKHNQHRGAEPAWRALKPGNEDPVEFGTELTTKAGGVRTQDCSMERRREHVPFHRFDSGRRRWALAASTWSASRRASAFAVAWPWAVIR